MGKNFKFGVKKNIQRKQRMRLYHKKKKSLKSEVFEEPNHEEGSARTTRTFDNDVANKNQVDGSNVSNSNLHGSHTKTKTFNCDIENTDQVDEPNVSNSNLHGSHTKTKTFNCNIENTDQVDEPNVSNSNLHGSHTKTKTFNCNIENTDQVDEPNVSNSNLHGSHTKTKTFNCNIENTDQVDEPNVSNSNLHGSHKKTKTFNCNIENIGSIFDVSADEDENCHFEWIDGDEKNQLTDTAEDCMEIDVNWNNVNVPNPVSVQNDDVSSESAASFVNSNDQDQEEDYDGDVYGNCDVAAETRCDGRRIVEMNYFLHQLEDVADHNFGECLYGDTEVKKEIKNGLHSKLIFGCNRCGKQFTVSTNESEKTTETLCVNSTAVLASNMIGIGYSQLEQFTSILDIPTMCADRFKSLNDDIGALWEMTAEQSMKEAAEEERQAAIERGDIDEEDGIPFISVVTDGCWCKRSYNKNYNALSGVAAIVGATFGKVLWIGVRNKYCVICVRNKNKGRTPPPHFCTCNYVGPSSEMEWQSIVQGFTQSVDMYNMRYMKVIADGDSSTYFKIMEAKPYQHRIVEKDECCNHLLRNFRRQLESATTGCPRGLTKHVENSLERIRKGISCAVKYRNGEENVENEKISLLKSDISNVIHHVFGDHANCPSYIKEKCKDEENYIPALQQSGSYEKLSVPIRKLMYCSKDLLLGETNNIAEHYNSIVAKFVGGKRVNFALSNSYLYKAHAAAVQFNSKKAVTKLYQTAFKKNPPVLTQKIELKRLQKAVREKDRRTINKQNRVRPKRFKDTKDKGSGYGENCQTSDMTAEVFENEKKIIMEKLKNYQANRIKHEEDSRTRNVLFQRMTRIVLMASSFGAVAKARVLSKKVKDICKQMISQSKADKHNNQSQPIAKQQLAKEQQISIRDCGVYIDKEHMCLGASPTGITDDGDMIIEIHCPAAIASKDPMDPSILMKLPYMERNKEGKLGLKKSDDLYYQIQGQLHILEKNVCLFAVWTSSLKNMYVERIERDENFFNSKIKTRLVTFYYDWLLPELIDPRLARNMAVRELGLLNCDVPSSI